MLLGGLAMFGPFSIDSIFPAFPQIGGQFGADTLAMQQTISVYLIAYAAMSLVHGPLSDAVGRRKVILGGLAVFALASAGCALARDLPTLLAFRALQGLSAGVGLIVGRAVIRDVLDGDAAQKLMAQVSMIFGIAPAIAPVIGGWLLGFGRWPLIFWFLVGFAVLLFVAVLRALPETHPPVQRLPLRVGPMLRGYARIARNPRFLRLTAAAAFNFGALFLYIASAPVFVLEFLGLGERQFGWFFIPMISGMMVGAFLSGRLAGKVPGATQIALGFACCALAVLANSAYTALVEVPTVPWAVLPMTLNAFGIALVFPVITLMVLDMYPKQRGSASSLQAFGSLVLNALIAGVLSPLLTRDRLWLAAGAVGFMMLAWLLWRWECRHRPKQAVPDSSPNAARYEPTDRM